MGILNKESSINPLAALESAGFHLIPAEDVTGSWVAIKKWDICGVRIIYRPDWDLPWVAYIFDSRGTTFGQWESFGFLLKFINRYDHHILSK